MPSKARTNKNNKSSMRNANNPVRPRPIHELLNIDEADGEVGCDAASVNVEKHNSRNCGSSSMMMVDMTSLRDLTSNHFVIERGGIPHNQGQRKLCTWMFIVFVISGTIALLGIQVSERMHQLRHSDGSGGLDTPVYDANDIMSLRQDSTVFHAQHGAVATDHPVCSSLGHHILNIEKGNVVDAAVATALCLGVANPASSGIGGGNFILIHINPDVKDVDMNTRPIPPHYDERDAPLLSGSNKETIMIDARETAPLASHRDMFDGMPPSASTDGGLSIAVPGELKGLELAHSLYGKLTWAEVVDPSIKLARDGLPVSQYLADAIGNKMGTKWDSFADLRTLLSRNRGGEHPLLERDIYKNEALAQFLESVKVEGANALYDGSHTAQFLQDIRESGGILQEEDLHNYQATIRSPLVAKDIRGYNLVSAPPPSSGGATLIGAARFLAGYSSSNKKKSKSSEDHRLVEALKHAFAIRMSLSDADYDTATVKDAVNDLISGDYMKMLRDMTNDDMVLPLSSYGGAKWSQIKADALNATTGRRQLLNNFGYLEDHGTSHLSVMDSDGNAVSMTSSINTHFGSGIVSKSTGTILNNQMDDFALPGRPNFFGIEPAESNYIEPGKRPLSSMAPTLVLEKSNNNVFMALGASGGPKIVSATLQAFWNYAVKKMDLFDAVASPRLHDQLLYQSDPVTMYETTEVKGGAIRIETTDDTKSQLEQRGHALIPSHNEPAVVQIVVRDRVFGKISAVSDIRKGGRPAGS